MMVVSYLAVLFALLISATDFVDADIRNLVKHLMEDEKLPYTAYIRPVKNENTTKNISYDVVPKNLITFDEVKQQIRLRVWLREVGAVGA
ncbi:neuronal acetylcholine receptor subunit alpha-5-like isoform X2 [Anneissia japonica]|nr:neuronal acetylcholine receptor subunit alpha-5-like isoform X2 [Anneissia japonica]XP_033108154.1 neuronal acetylcholine receptor subunit alpha-5-like isoform X2 [Anneissia japonica]